MPEVDHAGGPDVDGFSCSRRAEVCGAPDGSLQV
jgi:hypothetical protein